MDETRELFKWDSSRQYFAAIIVNLIAFTQGCAYGWASPALPLLISNATPLRSGPLSTDQMSWIGSINALGAIFSTLVFCYFISLLGAKRASICIAIPYAIAYLLIYFGETFVHILLARFLTGFAGGGTDVTITIFVSEISNDNIRGRLASMTPLYRNFGILFSFIIGARVDYRYVPCIYIVVPILFLLTFVLFPNSPQYYLQRGQLQEAEKALKFYKGYKGNNDHQEEVAFHKEFERLKAIANEPKSKEKTTFNDFCNRNALKGIGIGIALFTFMPFAAVNIITSYAVNTLQKVGTTIDPFTSSILLAIGLILGSLASTYLADILGRRILNLTSFFGAAAGFTGTAIYHYLNLHGFDLTSFAWLPVMCLFFVIFIASAGITSLISVCCVENVPTNIRTSGMAIIFFWANVCQFTSLKTYPKLLEIADLLGFLIIYGTGCIIAAFFVLFVLKETAGKSIDNIDVNQKTEDAANPDYISTKV